MIRVALTGLAARKLRTALTAVAIVIGVAMVSGAFTVTDTMRGAADALSASAYDGTDAVVSARAAFKVSDAIGVDDTIPASTLAQVRAVPQVGVAVGDITDQAHLVGRDGRTIGSGPFFGVGYDASRPQNARLSPFRLDAGRWATAPGEVVIDAGTAQKHHYRVGQEIPISARAPAQPFRIVGVARFGSVTTLGTATVAVFDLPVAQRLFGKPGAYDDVLVAARPGVSGAALRAALRRALPPSLAVRTPQAQDRFTLDGLKSFISIIKAFLLAFGGVSILVGAFTIFNTLSITVAQRAREIALLRAVGAERRQVLGSVVLETALVGVGSSLLGLFAGLGIGKGLIALMTSLGLDLPRTALVFAGRTVVVSMLVGTLVTLLAGLAPALRATRVSPVTVMREGAHIPPGRIGRRAPQISAGLLALAIAVLAYALFGSGLSTGTRLITLVPGCIALFVAVALLSPRLVRPLASLLGRPAERLGRQAGVLARRNAMRNPGRTATTAAALMIGVALVTFVAVLANGLRDSTTGQLKRQIAADYVLAGDSWNTISGTPLRALRATPGVRVATGIAQSEVRAFGRHATVDGVEPALIGRVFRYEWKHGSGATLPALGEDGAIVRQQFATAHHLKVGSRLVVVSPSDRRLALVVRGIERSTPVNPLGLGQVTVSRAAFDRTFPVRDLRLILVQADRPGAAAQARIAHALAGYPDVRVRTAAAFVHAQAKSVDSLLAIVYVLLALAVIVSLFGIVNTLVLSVLERTREVGTLRAIGMTRRQVRRMVRHESVITALIGAALGIGLGLFLAALVTAALAGQGIAFALPAGSLVAFVVVAMVAGVLAAILPARRAARMDVLGALAYE